MPKLPSYVVCAKNPMRGSGYGGKVQVSASFTEDDFYKKFSRLEATLRKSLKRYWKEDCCGEADFAIADDWNLAWFHCGGIYSRRICTPLYVELVRAALQQTEEPKKWAYHTAVELRDEEIHDLPTEFGFTEFVITWDKLYIPSTRIDFSCLWKV